MSPKSSRIVGLVSCVDFRDQKDLLSCPLAGSWKFFLAQVTFNLSWPLHRSQNERSKWYQLQYYNNSIHLHPCLHSVKPSKLFLPLSGMPVTHCSQKDFLISQEKQRIPILGATCWSLRVCSSAEEALSLRLPSGGRLAYVLAVPGECFLPAGHFSFLWDRGAGLRSCWGKSSTLNVPRHVHPDSGNSWCFLEPWFSPAARSSRFMILPDFSLLFPPSFLSSLVFCYDSQKAKEVTFEGASRRYLSFLISTREKMLIRCTAFSACSVVYVLSYGSQRWLAWFAHVSHNPLSFLTFIYCLLLSSCSLLC